jgi:hypothetical protein
MAGEVLRDLAGQSIRDFDMIMFAQLAQRMRRRGDDERFELVGERPFLQHRRDVGGEPVFFHSVEIDLADGAARRRHHVGDAPGTVGLLLMIGRVDPRFGMLDHQVRVHTIAFVAQKQRLTPVGDEDQNIVA